MRAKVIQSFRDKENGRMYRKRDIISISKARFDALNGKYVTECGANEKLSPKRDELGKCITCNKK